MQLQFNFIQIKDSDLFQDIAPRIVEKFWEFHQENPDVYRLFRQYANELRARGFTHHGAKAIMERVRWETSLETNGSAFKIANNHTSCYARLLMLQEPSFADFFEIRKSPGTVSTYYETEGAA